MRNLKKILAMILVFTLVLGISHTRQSNAAGSSIVVSTASELNSALKSGKYTKVTLRTDEAVTVKIKAGEYENVSIVIDAPNAKIKNNAEAKKVYILGAKKFTEYASGNTISIRTEKMTLVAAQNAEIKSLGVTKDNAKVTIDNRGTIEKVTVNNPADVNLKQNGTVSKVYLKAETDLSVTGESEKTTKLRVYEAAAGSSVESSVAVKTEAYADAEITLKEGAEKSTVKIKNTEAEVAVQNKTEADITITDSEKGTSSISAGEEATVKGDEIKVTEPEATPAPETTPTPEVTAAPTPAPVTPAPVPTSEPSYVPYVPSGNTVRSYSISYEAENATVKLFSPLNVEIPKGVYLTEGSTVYVKVEADTGYEIAGVTSGNIALSKNENGYYILNSINVNTILNVSTVIKTPSQNDVSSEEDQTLRLWSDYLKNGGTDQEVTFPDKALENIIKTRLCNKKPGDTLMLSDVYEKTVLSISGKIPVVGPSGVNVVTVTDLSGIEKLVNLKIVYIYMQDIEDLSPLARLDNLKHLEISANGMSSVDAKVLDFGKTGTEQYKSLETLIIQNSEITDFSFLTGMPELRRIVFSGIGFDDISALKPLTKLNDLSISGCDVSDISSLVELQNITKLGMSYNPITDYSPVYSLKNLETIYLDDASVIDFSKLKTLPALKGIEITGTIDDVNWLADYQGLELLTISPASYDSLAVQLKNMNSLKRLFINNCTVIDLSVISGLTSLEELGLYNCGITDITALGGLTNLKRICLADNNITDITALSKLTNLENVDLSGNNIDDISVLLKLDKLVSAVLEEVGLIDQADIDLLKNKCTEEFYYYPSSEAARMNIAFDCDEHVSLKDISIDENGIYIAKDDETFTFRIEAEYGYTGVAEILEKGNDADVLIMPGQEEDQYDVYCMGWGNVTIGIKALREVVYSLTENDGTYLTPDDAQTHTITQGESGKVFEALIKTDEGTFKPLTEFENYRVISSNENVLIVSGSNPKDGLNVITLNAGNTEILIIDTNGRIIAKCSVQVVRTVTAEQNDQGVLEFKLNSVEIKDVLVVATGGAISVITKPGTEIECDELHLEKLIVSDVSQQGVQSIVDMFLGVRRVYVPKDTDISLWRIMSNDKNGRTLGVNVIRASR